MTSKIVTAALVAFFPMMINTISGLNSADKDRIDLILSLGGSELQVFTMLRFPSALPFIMAGLEIAMALSLIGTVVTEFLGAEAGLGMLMQSMNFIMDVAGSFSVLIVLAVLGLLLNQALIAIRHRVLFWERLERVDPQRTPDETVPSSSTLPHSKAALPHHRNDRVMRVFFSKRQLDHRPQQIMLLGRLVVPVENPERLEVLAGRLTAAGLTETEPHDMGREGIDAIHNPDYVDFLASSYDRWAANPKAGPEVLPNTHPYQRRGSALAIDAKPPCNAVNAQAGWYIGDLNCAIGAGTWGAVYASAQAALSAAHAIIDGAPSAFALCRPPGHHAFADRASGFCFLNNAAIAANLLGQRAGKVAILDFDTHHGDGTQAIFYQRKDVLVASVHTDPSNYYPYFSGYADKRGEGEGVGANLNLPLAPGSESAALNDTVQLPAENP